MIQTIPKPSQNFIKFLLSNFRSIFISQYQDKLQSRNIYIYYIQIISTLKNPMQENKAQGQIITFKPTTAGYAVYKHQFLPQQTVLQIKQTLMKIYSVEYEQIKLIFKGKVLNDKQTATQLNLRNGVVMLVINKKVEQPKKNNTDQTIPKIPSTFNTGMGGAMPVGFGGYGIVNHPQYMSAISGAVNQEKIDEMLDDPATMSMMEQMMQDPDTLKYLIQQNPMLKNMFNQNPSMKMILDNPALMKAVFNPETLKKTREIMKNQGNGQVDPNNLGGLAGLNGMTGFPGLGNMGAMGNMGGGLGSLNGMFGIPYNPMAQMQMPNTNTSTSTSTNQTTQPQVPNPTLGMGYPMYPMMNPFLFQQNLNNPNPTTANKQIPIEQKYKQQLKQLQSMGFKDRQENIRALIQSKGDVDGAIQKLCKD